MAKLAKMRRDKFPCSLQLCLISCLIAINDVEDAELILASEWGDEVSLSCEKIDLTIHNQILTNLFKLLDIIIDEMY